MSAVTCRDIFDGVYFNVRGAFIEKMFSAKTKSKTLSKNVSSIENLLSTTLTDQNAEKDFNEKENDTVLSETTVESVDREKESDVANEIKLNIEEKFPFVMASVCSDLSALDRAYRKWKEYDEQVSFSEAMLESTEAFPLSERFVYPCIMYVSSMVLLDVDEELSDKLYDKYATAVSLIASEIPFESDSTVEKYPY